MEQLTEQQAIALAEGRWWKKVDLAEAARFQLYQDRLCMDFSAFHEGIEKLLDRPVWTHEFAKIEGLRQESEGERPRPTLKEIIEIIPKGKRIVAFFDTGAEASRLDRQGK